MAEDTEVSEEVSAVTKAAARQAHEASRRRNLNRSLRLLGIGLHQTLCLLCGQGLPRASSNFIHRLEVRRGGR